MTRTDYAVALGSNRSHGRHGLDMLLLGSTTQRVLGHAKVPVLVVRGDHELNAVKAQKLPGVASPLRMASAAAIAQATGAEAGYLGPVGFKGRMYADHAALALQAFKDMGAAIPGHGGVLDRVDSLLVVGPLLAYLVHWVEPFRA